MKEMFEAETRHASVNEKNIHHDSRRPEHAADALLWPGAARGNHSLRHAARGNRITPHAPRNPSSPCCTPAGRF